MIAAERNGSRVDVQELKLRARGQWPEILCSVGGIDPAILDQKPHPCPKCGGRDRFRYIDDEAGCLFCNQCFKSQNGDGLAALQWLLDIDFPEACKLVADHLRLTPHTNGNGHKPKPAPTGRKFSSWQEAVAASESHMGPRSAEWFYPDAAGNVVMVISRWDLANGKTIRPFAEAADGSWFCGAMPEPRPLYRLKELRESTGPVWVVEGEPAADALAQLGLTVTTSSGGSNAAGKTDWKPLAGREVILWRDHDAAGLKYTDDVKSLLKALNPVPTVREIDPGTLGLKEAEDAADWSEARDAQEPQELVAELERIAEAAPAVLEPPKRFRIEFIDSSQFAGEDYRCKFAVRRVIVHGQPCILGGAQKTLKTSVAVDLAISLGTGTPFLGEFEVPEAVPVGMLSGESGAFTLQETARRVAHARGRLLSDTKVYWGFKLPQLGLSEHLKALADAVNELELKALIIDPAYLCLLRRDDGSTISFSNVFEMGAVLGQVSEAFAGLDCTPIILHHETKGSASLRRRGDYGPPELSDLSMAGFAEWARQWVLVARREAYEHGTGIHRLWMNAGGSAGHGGLWAVDIDEGQLQEDFTGRKWSVSVATPEGVRQVRQDATEARKSEREEARDQRDRERLLDAYSKFPNGETARAIRSLAKLSGERFPYINQLLIDEGRVEAIVITKKSQTFDGFRMVAEDVDPSLIQRMFPESEGAQ